MIDFLKYRHVCLVVSVAFLITGVAAYFLMGDFNYGKGGDCKVGGISIVDYIDRVVKENPNEKYNLFVEARIPPKLQLQEGRIKKKLKYRLSKESYIQDLVNYSYKNYKKIPNMNIHFVDIRIDENKPMINNAIESYNRKVGMLLNILEKVEKSEVDYLDIFKVFAEDYIKYLLASYAIIINNEKNDRYEHYSSDLLLKEIVKLRQVNPEAYETIKERVKEHIILFLRNVDLTNEITFDQLVDLFRSGVDINAMISDFYTLARILKSDEYVNNIIYVGQFHYHNMKGILFELGFNLVKEILSDEHAARCTAGVIGFDEFFRDPYIKS